MSRRKILLVDNQPRFLDTCAQFLELAGYTVEKAHSVDEGRRALEERHVHLAVIDMRLMDDTDDKDSSGIALAKKTTSSIPKIILTAFQSWESVRESLGARDSGMPPAVSFVAKQEGLEVLLDHIQRAFLNYVRINWDLKIDWKARDHYSIAKLMDPELEDQLLLERSGEIEDLFRSLFVSKDKITIDRQIWQRNDSLMLIVHAYDEKNAPESVVVLCGSKMEVMRASSHYREYAPIALGHNATVLNNSVSSEHYAACLYALAGADLENVYTLTSLFQKSPERAFNAAVTHLFQETLAEWHQNRLISQEDKVLDEIYRERLDLTADIMPLSGFEARVDLIVQQAPTLGIEIKRQSKKLSIRFGNQLFSYPDPATMLHCAFHSAPPTLLIKTPGRLSGDNVLADLNGKTWLTDFSESGLAPLLWNFVAIESSIRFDLVDANNLQQLHEMEQTLVRSEFSKLYLGDIDTRLRKHVRAINLVRKLATRIVNQSFSSYHMGIFFQASRRIADFESDLKSIKKAELLRLVHLVVAAALICERLSEGMQKRSIGMKPPMLGISLEAATHEVKINGILVPLRGQSYELLQILYSHENQLCTRQMLVEQLFEEKFDELNESQISRLNTAIRRLREKIEDDPDHPQFIMTAPLGGYKLSTRPNR